MTWEMAPEYAEASISHIMWCAMVNLFVRDYGRGMKYTDVTDRIKYCTHKALRRRHYVEWGPNHRFRITELGIAVMSRHHHWWGHNYLYNDSLRTLDLARIRAMAIDQLRNNNEHDWMRCNEGASRPYERKWCRRCGTMWTSKHLGTNDNEAFYRPTPSGIIAGPQAPNCVQWEPTLYTFEVLYEEDDSQHTMQFQAEEVEHALEQFVGHVVDGYRDAQDDNGPMKIPDAKAMVLSITRGGVYEGVS